MPSRMTKQEKALIEDLIQAGMPMSNWLYNQSQLSDFAGSKYPMMVMVREWDAMVSRIHAQFEDK